MEEMSGKYKNRDEFKSYCYMCCRNADWDEEKIRPIARSFDLSVSEFIKIAKNYHNNVDDIVKINDPFYQAKRKEIYLKSKYNEANGRLIEKLIKENDEEKIIALLESEDVDINALYHRGLVGYLMNVYPNDYKSLLVSVRDKLNLYRSYLIKKRKTERNLVEETEKVLLPKAQFYVKLFAESDVDSLDSFLKSQNLAQEQFLNLLRLVKKYDQELLNVYETKLESLRVSHEEFNKKLVERIVGLMRNGVLVNSVKRPFDILDYYLLVKMEPLEFIREVNKYGIREDVRDLRIFMRKYHLGIDLNDAGVEKLLDNYVELNCQKDDEGFPILGSGRIIERHEKVGVIQFLRDKEVPVNSKTYDLAIRRFVNNEISLVNEEKEKFSK